MKNHTYDEIADYLTDGFWGWSSSSPRAFAIRPGGVLTANVTNLTEAGKQLARWALDAWSNVTGIRFEFTDGEADINFDDTYAGSGGQAWAISTNGKIISAHVNVSPG